MGCLTYEYIHIHTHAFIHDNAGNIEGLPTTLKTVYVQHDDATDDKGDQNMQK